MTDTNYFRKALEQTMTDGVGSKNAEQASFARLLATDAPAKILAWVDAEAQGSAVGWTNAIESVIKLNAMVYAYLMNWTKAGNEEEMAKGLIAELVEKMKVVVADMKEIKSGGTNTSLIVKEIGG